MFPLVLALFGILIIVGLLEIREVLANGFEASSRTTKGAALLVAIYLTGEVAHLATIAAPAAATVALYRACSGIEARAVDEEMANDDYAFQLDNRALGQCADRFKNIRGPVAKAIE
jgi:hypothetical protein